jgi:hypothetical protein
MNLMKVRGGQNDKMKRKNKKRDEKNELIINRKGEGRKNKQKNVEVEDGDYVISISNASGL